jgi:hypothetical protein
MALVSAITLVRSLALFHITLAYFFLTNPNIISGQNVVFVLGEAMQLPHPRDFLKPTAASGFIAVILAFLGLSDLTSASMADEIREKYWLTQTPVRLLFLFIITGYTYAFKEGGMFAPRTQSYQFEAGEGLNNSLVFTFGFLELSLWFWVFLALRDERRQRGLRLIEKRKAEAARL